MRDFRKDTADRRALPQRKDQQRFSCPARGFEAKGLSVTSKSSASATAERLRHRRPFALVLAASLLLAVAQPLMSGFFDERGTFDVFFSLLIITVLVLVFEQREHRRVAFSLGRTK
jgi:hypothetical protein